MDVPLLLSSHPSPGTTSARGLGGRAPAPCKLDPEGAATPAAAQVDAREPAGRSHAATQVLAPTREHVLQATRQAHHASGTRGEHAAAPARTLEPEALRPAPMAKWTVLFYHDGDSSLESFIAKNLRDIKATGATNDVRLVAESSRVPNGDSPNVQRVVVGKPGQGEVVDKFRADLQDPETLRDFVSWGMKAYPAEHTMLVVGGHGGGFLGVCCDDEGNSMSLADFKGAMRDAAKDVGRSPDILGFDACLMGQAEVLHSLEGTAPLVVASEETIGGDGFPYKAMLGALEANPQQSPRQYVSELIDAASDDQLQRLEKNKASACDTLAAYDMSAFPAVRKAMDQLASAIIDSGASKAQIARVAGQTQHFDVGDTYKPYSEYRDLGDFAKRLQESKAITSPAVKSAAARLEKALGSLVVAEQHESDTIDDATGLSAWIPTGYKAPLPEHSRKSPSEAQEISGWYQETDFAGDTKWTDLLAWLGNRSSKA